MDQRTRTYGVHNIQVKEGNWGYILCALEACAVAQNLSLSAVDEITSYKPVNLRFNDLPNDLIIYLRPAHQTPNKAGSIIICSNYQGSIKHYCQRPYSCIHLWYLGVQIFSIIVSFNFLYHPIMLYLYVNKCQISGKLWF